MNTTLRSQSTKSPFSTRVQAFLAKHMKGGTERVQANFDAMVQFNAKYLDSMDEILNTGIASVIFELRDYLERELTTEKESQMLETLRNQLDKHLPMPNNEDEITRLNAMYRNFDQGSGNNLPEYYEHATYLPTGMMPENLAICKIYNDIRRKLSPLVLKLKRLEYSIQLREPSVSDVQNTGVWVQRTAIYWVYMVKWTVDGFLRWGGLSSYFWNRTYYLSIVFANRQLLDGRLVYINWERDNFRYVRDQVRSLSMELLMLHHSIMLHIDIIKSPRADYSASLAGKVIN